MPFLPLANLLRYNRFMQTLILIAISGMIGVLVRHASNLLLKDYSAQFPLSTFTVNLAGCFIIGVIHVLSAEREILNNLQRTALMVGFLGGLTTFSSFALESMRLLEQSQTKIALTYVLLSVTLGLGSTYLGLTLTRKVI